VHTRWIETEWTGVVEPYSAAVPMTGEADERETVVVEVGGKRIEVSLPAFAGLVGGPVGTPTGGGRPASAHRSGGKKAAMTASGDALTSPMQGTIVKIAVADGDEVAVGDLIVVLEAMKMEQPLNAHRSGKISGLIAAPGQTVTSGSTLCEIVDAE
jgi:acetyl-CoA/propionyl-CoA carboxylase biotin carboxyl carrier protein